MTATPVHEIVTARLRLRRAVPDDLAALHEIMADAETMRFWSTPPHTELETTRAWLAGMIAAPRETSDDFIIERNGRLIGKLGAWRLPEVGFLISRQHWGQGYAGEALQAFIGYALPHRTDHLTADVDPRNERSLALLARAGFYETGRAENTFRVGDAWCDSVYLRLDACGA